MLASFIKATSPPTTARVGWRTLTTCTRPSYYSLDANGDVIGTVRAHQGVDGPFLPDDIATFELDTFSRLFDQNALAVVNKFAVDRQYRGTRLPKLLLQRIYLDGLKNGVFICFFLCEERLVPWYQRYGCRVFGEPVQTKIGDQLRYRMVLCMKDRAYLAACGDPLAEVMPDGLDDYGASAEAIRQMGQRFE